MKQKISLFFTTIFVSAISVCSQTNPTVLDLKSSLTDSNVVYPETYEANSHKLLEGWYMKNYMAHDDRYNRLDDTNPSDEEVRKRLAQLPTVIEMPFNSVVRDYIDRYTKRGREQVTVLLGLGHYYLPIFEQALEERGLPLELKYLPVIESALDPNAVSKHGATGLWQFMITTAKGMGLEVNSLVDERRDPYKSSKKAAQYLSDLYATYGNWSLAIAAYNCGPGAINKAIRRAGGDPSSHDFWSIYNYLTPETRGYFPMFIAANYVMNYYPEHNISPVIPTKPLVTDTVEIQDRIHFNQISEILDIPVEELRVLNPQFRADIIPASEDRVYTLILPSQQVHAYIMSEDAIKNFEADKYLRRETVEPGDQLIASTSSSATQVSQENGNTAVQAEPSNQIVATPSASKGVKTVIHKVKAKETLASIADKYGVTPEEIKSQNSMSRNAVRIGQQLRINTASNLGEMETIAEQPTPAATAPVVTSSSSKKATVPAKKPVQQKAAVATTHKLKSGDNLSNLAKKYGVSVEDIKKVNNMSSDNLRAGETLKIPAKASSGTSRKSTSSKSKKRRRR